MEDGAFHLEHLDAGLQQILVVGLARLVHQAVVGHAGEDDLHLHPAPGGVRQGLDDLGVRHEIGGGEVDGLVGLLHGQDVGPVDLEIAPGPAAQHPHGLVAGVCGGGEVGPGIQAFRPLAVPGLHEQQLQGRDRGPFDPQVGVAPAEAGGRPGFPVEQGPVA